MRTFVLVAASLCLASGALADPILPTQDKAGSLLKYQALTTADRRATLEAFSGQSMKSDSTFENLDACTLRQTTEDNAASLRLSKAVAGCVKELGL
ncbi:MAG: hypothetical protein H2042_04520 [Rhizobiales bacterium]|nr:hypothetical protein [Hyphomicrobiales bacterium]